MAEVQVECEHKRVNYSMPMTCADCGAVLGEDDGQIKAVSLDDLPPEKRAAIAKAVGSMRRKAKPAVAQVQIEGVGGEVLTTGTDDKSTAKKGEITRLESATAKERIFTVNGVKFFAAVGGTGHRILTACHKEKKLLESASRVLFLKGYNCTLKRDKKEKDLWLLSAKEKVPSGPWPDEEKAGG